ncbi:MAG TPA: NYN domain-containing protein [Ornithinibacter sp.]|nr:NYN domain-containing protein [Ornithinibacter sp.]
MDKPAQIALLIDADNATAARIDVILGELSTLGETNVRRAYGNWTKTGLKSWQQVLHENAIRPVQQFDPSKGKNASDIALAVDAVEILHTQRPDAFALVSSDADFTPLVMHLREHGAHVYGFGDAKTPAAFQSACTRFLVLDRLSAPSGQADAVLPVAEDDAAFGTAPAKTSRRATAATTSPTTAGATASAAQARAAKTGAAKTGAAKTGPAMAAAAQGAQPTAGAKATAKKASAKAAAPVGPPPRATRAQLRGDNKLVALLRRAVDSAADDSGWARVGTVANHIANQSSFDSRNYGYAKLSKLLEATDLFEIRDSGGPAMALRDRRTGLGGGSTTGTTAANG